MYWSEQSFIGPGPEDWCSSWEQHKSGKYDYMTQMTYINEIFNTASVIHSALMTCWLCAPHSITLQAGLGWQLNCK